MKLNAGYNLFRLRIDDTNHVGFPFWTLVLLKAKTIAYSFVLLT